MAKTFNMRELEIITDIAATQSLSLTAIRLGIAQANLSRALSQIEEKTKIKIINRSSRPLALTPFGLELMLHIQNHINTHNDLCTFIEHYRQSPSGFVRILAPAGHLFFIARYVIPVIRADHPDIKVELITSNLTEGEFSLGVTLENDCDILFTHSLPRDDSLVATKVAAFRTNVYGTDALIKTCPVKALTDYAVYPCILFYSFIDKDISTWDFYDTQQRCVIKINVNGHFSCDNAWTAIELAKSGAGYLYIPDIIIREMGCEGCLQPTVPEHVVTDLNTYMIYKRRAHQPYRVEVVIDTINRVMRELVQA